MVQINDLMTELDLDGVKTKIFSKIFEYNNYKHHQYLSE